MKTTKYIFQEVFANQFNGDSCFPEIIEEGKVYFCKEYSISVHLCPCGCGDKVYIPFKGNYEKGSFWSLKNNSFSPSIKKTLGCLSHYFITNGLVTS